MANVVSIHRDRLDKTDNQFHGETMDSKAFRVDIARPALRIVSMWSTGSENLIVWTGLAESGLRVVKQIGGGCALGLMQMEPETYIDCLRYLNEYRNRRLKAVILAALYMEMFPEASALMWNLRLAVLMARVKYWMKPEPLPDSNDVIRMANYWLEHYNGGGKGTVEHFVEQVKREA